MQKFRKMFSLKEENMSVNWECVKEPAALW